jgi:deoxyhypusine synthase
MIFSEATIALPLVAAYAYHQADYAQRQERRIGSIFDPVTSSMG